MKGFFHIEVVDFFLSITAYAFVGVYPGLCAEAAPTKCEEKLLIFILSRPKLRLLVKTHNNGMRTGDTDEGRQAKSLTTACTEERR